MKIIHNKKKFTLDIIFIFIGCLIASLGVNLFLTHARLLSGGATGIALIIEYLTGFQSGYTVFLINIPFTIWRNMCHFGGGVRKGFLFPFH